MASVSSAHLVLFIAAVLIAAALAGTVTESAGRLGNAIDENSQVESEQTDTAVRVVSDADAPAAVYDAANETLTLYVKNVGDSTLSSDPEDVTVLVNGTYASDQQTTVLDADEWRPGALLRVRVDVTLPPDSETRVVVNPTGARDSFVFTTP